MTESGFPALASVDGQAINLATIEQAVEAALHRVAVHQGFRLFTLNLDHIVKRRDIPAFRAAYAGADFVTADGAPVAMLARRQSKAIRRATGADLVDPLCRAAAGAGIPVALFGSTEASLAASAAVLKARYPALILARCEAPPFGFDPTAPAAEAAARRLAGAGARIVFVALGAPKQELFAARMAEVTPELGYVCIGAALDFLAGSQKRAPELFRDLGMEWIWRLAMNPSRLARRYAACAAIFVSLIVLRG